MDNVLVKRVDEPELSGTFVRAHVRDHRNVAMGTVALLVEQGIERQVSFGGRLEALRVPGRPSEVVEMVDRLYILMLSYFCGLPEPEVERIDDLSHHFTVPGLEELLEKVDAEVHITTMVDDDCLERVRRLADIDAVMEGQENRHFLALHHFTEAILRNTLFVDARNNQLMRLSDLGRGAP